MTLLQGVAIRSTYCLGTITEVLGSSQRTHALLVFQDVLPHPLLEGGQIGRTAEVGPGKAQRRVRSVELALL